MTIWDAAVKNMWQPCQRYSQIQNKRQLNSPQEM